MSKTKEKSAKGTRNLIQRIVRWVPIILESIDEGIVITVSKTGLAWSLLFWLIGAIYCRYKNNPIMYKDAIKFIISMGL